MPVSEISKQNAEATAPDNTNDLANVDTSMSAITTIDGDMTVISAEDDFVSVKTKFDSKISTSQVNGMMSSLSSGIFGMPYQFMENVDTVVEGTDFGRKYMEKIASVMPVMFICPGEPSFMTGYSDEQKSGMLSLFDDTNDMTVDDIMGNQSSARYYTFNSKFGTYTKYVNTMVRALSIYMGLGQERYAEGSNRLYRFELSQLLNKDFASLFNANTSLAFYLDSETSISENFSNSTTESQLSQKVNSYSDTARELEFMLGSAGVSGMYDNLRKSIGTADALNGVEDSIGLGKGVMKKVTSGLATVVSGGKMIFPEIWSGSDYSRSYTITMKLRSPDPDPLSILLNIYIPLCCITSLVMPKQIGYDANAYSSPFLVRATYKSIFNCELGIVSSVDIQKGGEDKWNALGMPTSVDVTITIKDLYSTMFMSSTDKGLLNNTSQLDYIALMAGIDMNKDWIARNIKLKAYLKAGAITTAPISYWENFKRGANKSTTNFLNNVLRSDIRWNR